MTARLSRRGLLAGASVLALTADGVRVAAAASSVPMLAVPMRHVRLLPSPLLDAMEVNRAYLMRLEPDRLLHNYRVQAGLAPKGAVYGGWESETIAGHTLGHYLSALSLLHAQTGDDAPRARVDYIVSELVLCQGPDGYVCGFTRSRNGTIEPGRAAFDEIAAGHIHSTGFDLNGAWSPLYNWHKLMAGLLDAQLHCGSQAALAVCTRLAMYLGGIFDRLDEAQMQSVLACEYGGLNESLAELSVRTGDRRWRQLAERIYDTRTLDPLAAGNDDLANLHANTQIPKVIGLARLYEITGRTSYRVASTTFWSSVTAHHSYNIGGNGDREYFTASDSVGDHVTEQTCETCASYNMLKLTRLLYAQRPAAVLFDYYERIQLNHIVAQQNPRTGMFAYMTPLMSGTSRDYSTPLDDFWCCVGTGMESHAKHGDSIYWQQGGALLVNLFVPSRLDWNGVGLVLHTDYPRTGQIDIALDAVPHDDAWTLRLRRPAWSTNTTLALNGTPIPADADRDGYLSVHRRWSAGDRVTLVLDMRLRLESPPGAPKLVSVLRGPSVLAADLGPASAPFDGVAPALVGTDLVDRIVPDGEGFRAAGIGRPHDLQLTAFAQQHDRRSASYFPVFTDAEWAVEQTRYRAEEVARRALAARAADLFHPGEMQSERDHALTSSQSFPVVYRGRNGRDARSGGFFAFRMQTRPGPLVLQATYWGEERNRRFRILVEGTQIALEQLDGTYPGIFVDRSYVVPRMLTDGRSRVLVRFEPLPDHSAGPAFAIALLTA